MSASFSRIYIFILFFVLPFITTAQKIGLLLDNYVTDRWYLDQKLFSDRVKIEGGECFLEVAYGDANEQYKLAQKLLSKKIDVLVIVPTDAHRAVDIVRLAKSRNIPVIAYDRLIYSNDISLYISYDNLKVGRLQAEAMLKRYPGGNFVLVNGPVNDNNAILFRKGQLEGLRDALKSGSVSLIGDYVLTDWSEIAAFEIVKEHIEENRPLPDVFLAANDALANGIIQALPTTVTGKVGITGQDADLTGVRNIITGAQSLTIYKPIRPLAYLAAEAALELSRGRNLKAAKLTKHGEGIEVNTILLDPVVVDKNNYKETVIRDGHASLSEVLKNIGSVFEEERNKVQLSLLQKENDLQLQKQINQRNIFIIISIFFVLSVAGLGYTIYNKQKDNRLLNEQKFLIERKNHELNKTNQQLNKLNEDLKQQQEEISAQRDAIAEQKEELEQVNEVIEEQKEAIQKQNETLEREVEKRTAELIQYNKQLEQYAFMTAHNLRSPVARILGLAELLKMDKDDPEQASLILDKLMMSTHELDRVIKDLNSILDIKNFSMRLKTNVVFQDLMNSIVENLQSEILNTRTTIKTDFQVKQIYSVQPYIHSILFNLISNSIKYRNPERDPVVTIQSFAKDNVVELVVTDNGLGIDLTAHEQRIFQLYKRFHFHTEGRGLGLFLVKTQVESLAGKIEIESRVNEGSTFRVILPMNISKEDTKPSINPTRLIEANHKLQQN